MKKSSGILLIIFTIFFLAGCSNSIRDYNQDPELTPPIFSEIPEDELYTIDNIQYRIVPDDYTQNPIYETDRYCPEFWTMIDDTSVNVLKSDKDLLMKASLFQEDIQKKISFGVASTEQDAILSAVDVIKKYYEPKELYSCIEYEQPFYICYNSNANAWIISGTSDIKEMRVNYGSVCMAIEKDTGILLMLYHTS